VSDDRVRSEAEQDRLAYLLLKSDIEDFLYQEVDLLDERRYEEWLDLLSEDIRYWVPLVRNVKFGEWERETTREQMDLNWFDEGKTTITQRVRQILTGIHWAEEPSSRVSHVLSNIRIVDIEPSVQAPKEVTVKSRLLLYRNRVATETDLIAGKRQDVLRQVDGHWKIARRVVKLDQNVLLAKSLTFFF
jgi:3-phenylpropionate/cinnamic acid dioxygenase small subunit